MSKAEAAQLMAEEVEACTACRLCEGRTQTVFGKGSLDADIMFVGEAPGANEDRLGQPFVGRSGKLLDRMIEAMGLCTEDVYIANVVKCRPPQNRDPKPDEVDTCREFLQRQIWLIEPKVIITLGKPAGNRIIQPPKTMAMYELRNGNPWDWGDVTVFCTFHPAYLLRSPGKKKEAWRDLQEVMSKVGL